MQGATARRTTGAAETQQAVSHLAACVVYPSLELCSALQPLWYDRLMYICILSM